MSVVVLYSNLCDLEVKADKKASKTSSNQKLDMIPLMLDCKKF